MCPQTQRPHTAVFDWYHVRLLCSCWQVVERNLRRSRSKLFVLCCQTFSSGRALCSVHSWNVQSGSTRLTCVLQLTGQWDWVVASDSSQEVVGVWGCSLPTLCVQLILLVRGIAVASKMLGESAAMTLR
jgi:hypothetical protein